MEETEFVNWVLFVFGGATLVLITFSKWLQIHWNPIPVVALAIGFALGPHALGLFKKGLFDNYDLVLEEGARVTLAIGLMGIALRLPKNFWKAYTRFFIAILTVGMLTMWLVGAGVLYLTFNLAGTFSFLAALLLAAIITPTDPIVSTPIVTGPIAKANIPTWQRLGISAESGSNDGLGLLIVLLPVYLITKGVHASTWTHWFTHALLKEVMVALIVGAFAGWAAARILDYSEGHNEIERTGYFGFTLALPIVILSGTRLIGADGILAVFVAGAVFDQFIPTEHQEHQEHIQEAINKFFTVGIFVLLGISLPLEAWLKLSWHVPAGLFLALILRRMVAVLIWHRALRPQMLRPEGIFLGWFAPIGIAALFYAIYVENHLKKHFESLPGVEPKDFWIYTSLAITISVCVHGWTATPFSQWLGRKLRGRKPERSQEKEKTLGAET